MSDGKLFWRKLMIRAEIFPTIALKQSGSGIISSYSSFTGGGS